MFPKILLLSSSLLFISHGAKTTLTPPQYKAVFGAKNDEKLRLMFAGDIMSQGLQIEAARKKDGSFDYTPCFQYIKPILETADLTIGNLECTLADVPPYTGAPNFRSPDQLAEALKKSSFDVLLTANNHTLDAGLYGVNHTIETLRKNKFIQTEFPSRGGHVGFAQFNRNGVYWSEQRALSFITSKHD